MALFRRVVIALALMPLGCMREGPKAASGISPKHELASAVSGSDAGAATRSAEVGPCLVIHEEPTGESVEVEGLLVVGSATEPFVLRLSRPRCVVGLRRERGEQAFVTEVYLASTGFDLRPLLGARLRVTGEALGATSSLERTAVVVLAASASRVASPAREP